MAHFPKTGPASIPPLILHLTPESEEECADTKRAASQVFEETVVKKARQESEGKTPKLKMEATSSIVYDPLTSEDLSKALESRASLQFIKNILQGSAEVKIEHLCLALRHYSKEGLYLLIIAQARQEAWKAIEENVKAITQTELPSFLLISDKETLKIASFESWHKQGMQLLPQLKELSTAPKNSTDNTQKGKECREACVLLISRFFDALTGAKLSQFKGLLNSCEFKNLRKFIQPVIQAVKKAYSLILIFQLGACKQDDPDRKQVEHNLKLLLKVMVVPKELVIFALYAHLSPDLFRPLCQWLSEQDRLPLIDQACRSPCSLEHMITLFWKGDPERIVLSIAHLTPDSPLIVDEQIVQHLKIAIEHKTAPEVIQFLIQRMQNQESEANKVRASSVQKQGHPVANSSARWVGIFELGLQHDLSLEILQKLAAILQANNLGKDFLIHLLSTALAKHTSMSTIIKLIHIAHPDAEVLSNALMDVLKAMGGKKTDWSWEDLSKFVHRLVYVNHHKPTYQHIECFLHQLSQLDKSIFHANSGFILDTLNSLLHSTNTQERKRLWKEFSEDRHLPSEIVNKLSSY